MGAVPAIDSVAIFFFGTGFNDYRLTPYEVGVGPSYGEMAAPCSPPANASDGLTEPGMWGVPAVAYCHGARFPYVTLRLLSRPGTRKWAARKLQLSDIAVYAESGARGMLLPPEPVERGQVAREVRPPSLNHPKPPSRPLIVLSQHLPWGAHGSMAAGPWRAPSTL